jgi:phosphoenolpyruvate---glycerone phosphotransferase subunit DhaK
VRAFVNTPAGLVADALAGFAAAHGDLVVHDAAGGFVRRRRLKRGKVALVSGGGSGHEPLDCGFVGRGMLDAACPGPVFTSPGPHLLAAAAKAVDTGAGCLFIVKNYSGDVMNFEMASEMAPHARTIIVADDISGGGADAASRRGVAGTLVVQKLCGAAAEAGATLDEVQKIGTAIATRLVSVGVAFAGPSNPVTGRAGFKVPDGEVEFGVGIHGEPGRRRIQHGGAADLVSQMLKPMIASLGRNRSKPMLLLVNGLGGTPLIEQYAVCDAAHRQLRGAGIEVARTLVGSHVTSLNTPGCSLTLAPLDETLIGLWDAPVATANLRWRA